MTVIFDESKEKEKLFELRNDEEEELMKILSDKYGLPYIDLRGMAPDPEALEYIHEAEAREAGLAPFKLVGKKLYVATLSPDNEKLEAVLRPLEDTKHMELLLFLCSHASLEHVYARYGDLKQGVKVEDGILELTPEKIEPLMESFETVTDLTSMFDELTHSDILYKTTRILELMMTGALKFGASDIHIEPEEDTVRLRYRINGMLVDIAFFDFSSLKNITSRLKLLSGLKLSTSANSQDGRFGVNLGDVEVDIRVSIIPGNYGESFVMRLLDPRNAVTDLGGIAFPEKLREAVEHALAKPNGVILSPQAQQEVERRQHSMLSCITRITLR
jgi:type II secretory ATPase GspE/PulE/Tfp pilus assembly ATPase PilB-like protein